MQPLADPEVRSVALVRLRVGMGDLLCTAPALRALRRARPDVHVALVTWREVAGVVDRLDGVDELLDFPGAPGIPERRPTSSLAGWLEEVRARRFHLAVQAYGDNPAANDVTAAMGARVTAGFQPDRGARHDPATHLPYPHDLHEVERHLRLLQHLGLPRQPGDDGMALQLTTEDDGEASAVRAAHGLVPGEYVVLHPGATSPSRLWPAERFAAVADALAGDGLRVVVAGVRSEAHLARAVVTAMRAPAVDLVGRTSLGCYAALLRDAAVLVANDTGAAHLAAAVGGRTVTVFLSGDPVRWQHGPDRQLVARADVGCNPCPHLACPIDHRCADRVSAAHVLRLARRLAARPQTPPPRPAGPGPGPGPEPELPTSASPSAVP